MTNKPERMGRGPFHPDQIKDGDRYEISQGHAIYCAPAGARHARATVVGSLVIDTDPGVEDAAIDAGFTPDGSTLRAPDISVGVPDVSGWVKGAPPLAIEYASVGQNEGDLQQKIKELLDAGTLWVWVVRLVGPRRVEVHTADAPMRTVSGQDLLSAPGVLKRSLPIAALYDRAVAHELALANLLERFGYRSLDAVRDEGREEGRQEGLEEGRAAGERQERIAVILEQLTERFGPVADSDAQALAAMDTDSLRALSRRVLSAPDADTVFGRR